LISPKTMITASPEAAFKLWLRHAKPTLGRIVVDDGAALALRERGTSLLAVGVVSAEGGFQAGDAVEVVGGPGATLVGKGISAMSADELRLVAGLKSDAVRERVPDAAPQVIHRDEFVLADARGAEIIVLGAPRRRLTAAQAAVLGKTVDYILRHATCRVLVTASEGA